MWELDTSVKPISIYLYMFSILLKNLLNKTAACALLLLKFLIKLSADEALRSSVISIVEVSIITSAGSNFHLRPDLATGQEWSEKTYIDTEFKNFARNEGQHDHKYQHILQPNLLHFRNFWTSLSM